MSHKIVQFKAVLLAQVEASGTQKALRFPRGRRQSGRRPLRVLNVLG
jgi:hypothetical protein